MVDVEGVGYELDVPMTTFFNLPAPGKKSRCLPILWCAKMRRRCLAFWRASEREAFRKLVEFRHWGQDRLWPCFPAFRWTIWQRPSPCRKRGGLPAFPASAGKPAERLLLELKDKLPRMGVAAAASGKAARSGNDVLNALLALGYNEREVVQVVKELPSDLSVEEGIRAALKRLSKF